MLFNTIIAISQHSLKFNNIDQAFQLSVKVNQTIVFKVGVQMHMWFYVNSQDNVTSRNEMNLTYTITPTDVSTGKFIKTFSIQSFACSSPVVFQNAVSLFKSGYYFTYALLMIESSSDINEVITNIKAEGQQAFANVKFDPLSYKLQALITTGYTQPVGTCNYFLAFKILSSNLNGDSLETKISKTSVTSFTTTFIMSDLSFITFDNNTLVKTAVSTQYAQAFFPQFARQPIVTANCYQTVENNKMQQTVTHYQVRDIQTMTYVPTGYVNWVLILGIVGGVIAFIVAAIVVCACCPSIFSSCSKSEGSEGYVQVGEATTAGYH